MKLEGEIKQTLDDDHKIHIWIEIIKPWHPRKPDRIDASDDGRFEEMMSVYDRKKREFDEKERAIKNLGLRKAILVFGECLCPECGTELKNGPDGPWCQKCDPGGPARFAAEEEAAFQAEQEGLSAMAEAEARDQAKFEAEQAALQEEAAQHQDGPEES